MLENILRSIDVFTDRDAMIGRFACYLHDDPHARKVLYFHGEGGYGESDLLTYLRGHCSYRVDSAVWAKIRGLSDEDVGKRSRSEPPTAAVPSAFVDFREPAGPQGDARRAFDALAMFRRQLGGSGVKFPIYNVACVWYLHQTRMLSQNI